MHSRFPACAIPREAGANGGTWFSAPAWSMWEGLDP